MSCKELRGGILKEVAAAIAVSGERVLVSRRAPGQSLAGLWEFPGGKVEAGEDVQTCIVRELKEELGVRAIARNVIARSEYAYPGGAIMLVAIEVILEEADFQLTVHDQHAWIELQKLLELDLAPADIPIAKKLQQIYAKDLNT